MMRTRFAAAISKSLVSKFSGLSTPRSYHRRQRIEDEKVRKLWRRGGDSVPPMIQLIEISARKPLPVHIHSLKRSLYSLYSLARTRPYGSKIDTKPTPNRKAN